MMNKKLVMNYEAGRAAKQAKERLRAEKQAHAAEKDDFFMLKTDLLYYNKPSTIQLSDHTQLYKKLCQLTMAAFQITLTLSRSKSNQTPPKTI